MYDKYKTPPAQFGGQTSDKKNSSRRKMTKNRNTVSLLGGNMMLHSLKIETAEDGRQKHKKRTGSLTGKASNMMKHFDDGNCRKLNVLRLHAAVRPRRRANVNEVGSGRSTSTCSECDSPVSSAHASNTRRHSRFKKQTQTQKHSIDETKNTNVRESCKYKLQGMSAFRWANAWRHY